MKIHAGKAAICLTVLVSALTLSACKGKDSELKDLPDLNALIRPYVTTANATVKSGPGPQFRTIAQIPQNAKVQVVGRDGDWVLIVSKKGNAPGFIELASVKPSSGEEQESAAPKVEGQFETLTGTQVRSGPGVNYPVVADIGKGTKINVVGEENGWLKVESKRGNKPGYVDASLAKPITSR
ncbi:MAG: SH3 domain-containing protein [Deltaproteobacteria bacterium]|nr:SH3 domain-containing protein [Deltaproteobacteria bacterium]MBI3064790.1 SH3 domain-containing protein [Deltaproteobacteria bacterium]